VEIAKGQLQRAETREQTVVTLACVLDISLRLLHPFTPFVTEELWGHLRRAVGQNAILSHIAKDWPEVLIIAGWPEAREEEGWETGKVADFTLLQDIVRSIRNLRAEKGVAPSRRIAATFAGSGKTALLQEQAETIASLAGLDYAQLSILESLPEKPKGAAALIVGPVEIYLPLAGMIDLEQERARLNRELAETESQIVRLEKLLASDFARKAPEAVVAREREKLAVFKETADKIKAQL
jgi:valyl-tRNA synthetase